LIEHSTIVIRLLQLASSWGATIMYEPADRLYHAFFDVVCANYTWMHIGALGFIAFFGGYAQPLLACFTDAQLVRSSCMQRRQL
jgi:hypothetical protein